MDTLPIWLFYVITVALVFAAIEAGYRLGQNVYRSPQEEKESPVSAISGAILGLLAFILAFTFAIVNDRYDARKGLVREEANALRTAYSRAEFLPEPDHSEAASLLREYVGVRLAVVENGDMDKIEAALSEADRIQRRLWNMAVANAREDMNSDVGSLYFESLNEVTNLHWMRVTVGIETRIPIVIWVVLYALVILGMFGVGYQTGITGSQRTWATVVLALAFSLVLALVVEMDRPNSSFINVSQQPLEDLQVWMDHGLETP